MPMAIGINGVARIVAIAPTCGPTLKMSTPKTKGTGTAIITASASHLSWARSMPRALRQRRTSETSEATAAAPTNARASALDDDGDTHRSAADRSPAPW